MLRGFRSVGTTSEGVGVFRDEYAWKCSPWYPPCEPRAGWGSRRGEAANKKLKMGQPAFRQRDEKRIGGLAARIYDRQSVQ